MEYKNGVVRKRVPDDFEMSESYCRKLENIKNTKNNLKTFRCYYDNSKD